MYNEKDFVKLTRMHIYTANKKKETSSVATERTRRKNMCIYL